MARQVLPIVGAVVGAYFGSPQLGYAIGTIVGNLVDPEVIKGPRIGEAGLQTSAEGVFRPVVYGTAAVKGNVIERGNRQVQTEETSAGKGGPTTETEHVYWTFAIRICEGPIIAVPRIWQDEKLVYDITPNSTIVAESEEFATRFRLYLGDEAQLPDPDIEAYRGVGNTPAYRGSAYIVFPNFDLTDRRESIPDFRFEVTTAIPLDPPNNTMASRRAGGSAEVSFSGNGEDWSSWDAVSGFDPIRIIGTRDRFITYGQGGTYNWTDNNGATWHQSSGLGPTGSAGIKAGQSSEDGQTIMIARGTNAPVISRDNGESFQLAGALIPMEITVPVANRWVGWRDNGRIYYSADEGATFNLGPSTIPLNNVLCGWSSFTRARFGGTGDGGLPYIVTTDGDEVEVDSLPGLVSATQVTAIAYDQDTSTWAAGTDSLQLMFNDGTGWAVSATTFPGYVCHSMTHNGTVFIAMMRQPGVGQKTALTITSDDGNVWTIVRTETVNSGTDLFIASLVDPEESIDVGSTTLAAIVNQLHLRAGQEPSQYDLSELTDSVYGFVIASDYTCADAIRSLMPVYFFGAAEYDMGAGYKIHYQKHGKPVVLTITIDDIISAPEKSVREDALERPRVIHLHYENPTVGYVPAKATARRDSPDVKVVGEKSLQIPVVFKDVDQPAKIVNKIQKIVWVEVAGEEEFTVSDRLLELVPGDCIGVSLRGQVRRMRIVQDQISPGEIRWRLMADRESAYTSNATGIPVPPPTPPLPSVVGPTMYQFLDIPALSDNHDLLIWYEAATGTTEAWYGAQTQHKAGAEIEFSNSVRFNRGTVMGMILADVPAASEYFTDTTNTVHIQLFQDADIDSLTDQQFLSEGGAFALENPDGTWEVMQYRDANQNSDGTYELSYLARGRLNTGGTEHEAGAGFVLLSGVLPVPATTAWLNTNIVNRAVSFGTSPDGATQYTDAYTGQSQREFPVANVLLDRVGDTINLRVVPRHRFGTETNPVRSLNWTGYRIVVTDGSNTINLDTVSDTSSFDVTGWSSPVTVTVSQLNRFTGAGPSVSEQIA